MRPGLDPKMIYYVCVERFAHTLASMLVHFRPDLRHRLRVIPYARLELLDRVHAGVVIWADVDRIAPAMRQRAAAIHERLAGRGIRLLNHPERSLRRFQLLDALAASGHNAFRVFRPGALPPDLRFPVFLRREAGALAVPPDLLPDRASLLNALDAAPMQGANDDDWIVAEYSAESEADGHFRKYGAYRIGDTVFAQHCFISPSWFVKHPPAGMNDSHRLEHREYVRQNPHADWVLQMFDLAGIAYGRIDYGRIAGRLQVFEINTNPMVLGNPQTRFDPNLRPYADRWAEAVIALDSTASAAPASDPAIDRLQRRILLRLYASAYRARWRRLVAGVRAWWGHRAR
ncbi:hypothetical protein [Thioalkalivibrio paradoxus]|nr:hypothetical protein [Thioalkalivibrio paradoxus]